MMGCREGGRDNPQPGAKQGSFPVGTHSGSAGLPEAPFLIHSFHIMDQELRRAPGGASRVPDPLLSSCLTSFSVCELF